MKFIVGLIFQLLQPYLLTELLLEVKEDKKRKNLEQNGVKPSLLTIYYKKINLGLKKLISKKTNLTD